jgi:hypothetical protein
MSGFLGLLLCSGAAGGTTPSEYISFGGTTPGKRVTVYPWNSTSGFGSAYTSPSAAQGILGNIQQTSFVPDNSNFAVCFSVSPYFSVYKWSALGFGTRFADPSTLLSPAGTAGAAFSFTNSVDAFLAVNFNGSQYLQAWAWNTSTGFGTKYSNSGILSAANASYACNLNGDSSIVGAQIFDSPYIYLYPWSSSSGFGTKYSNPATLPPGFSTLQLGLSFNKVTGDLAFGSRATPYIAAYATSSSGFGTKYSNPATPVASGTNGLRFSPDGSALGIINTAAPVVKVYQWGGGFGTRYADPASVPAYASAMDWQSTNNAIATSNVSSTPYTSVFSWSSSGFGAKYADPPTAPGVSSTVSFANQSR